MDLKEVVPLGQALTELGIPRASWFRLRDTGRVPPATLIAPRFLAMTRQDIDNWLETNGKGIAHE